MGDPLDDNLKKRIKEVFDNYEDTGADEGWLLLREKFPAAEAKRRGIAWFWWGAAAALILVITGIGLWISNENGTTVKLANKTDSIKNTSSQNMAKAKKIPDTAQNLAGNKTVSPSSASTGSSSTPTANTSVADTTSGTSADYAYVKQRKGHVLPFGIARHAIKTDSVISPSSLVRNKPEKQKITSNHLVERQSLMTKNKPESQKSTSAGLTAPPSTNSTQTNILAAVPTAVITKPQQASIANNSPVTPPLDKKQQRAINSMFANDRSPEKMEKLSTDKKVRFAVYAATYFNYAKGSSNQVNIGAGVSSDIRLSKNLRLVTGVSIAQNTLNYSSETAVPIAVSRQNVAAFAAVSSASTLTLAAKPQLEAGPTFKNYNANLVGLDVPLNLKYEFSPDKSDAYVSAGLSSGTFINQAYTYNYNYPVENTATQTDAQNDKKLFSNFYFAKTLNLSFGVGYPVGKTNTLVIEPFLKYPLDGLGAQQIRFGAGGINLKFGFKASKK